MTTETTIQCDCPQCGRVCGFKSCYAGRTARCLNCNTRFVIPAHTGQAADPCPQPSAKPLPDFYANALKGGIKAFVHPQSKVGLVFCMALVAAHFLLGDVDLSFTVLAFRPPFVIGWFVTVFTFGCFAWYCMEIAVNTRMDTDAFPPVDIGAGFDLLWLIVKSAYLFAVTLIVALLPASFLSAWFEYFNINIGGLYYPIAAICLLLWPMDIAIIAMEVPVWRIFRYDLIVAAIAKTFRAYLFTVLVTLTAFSLLWLGLEYFATNDEITLQTALGLLVLRLVGASMFIFAMRIIGVYCLHHADVCPDLWITPPPQRPGED